MEKCTERADRLPLAAKYEKVLTDVLAAATPTAAASIVVAYRPEEALHIIDNLDPLTAAIVMTTFHARADGHLHPSLACSRAWAIELVTKAEKWHIRGTCGLCYARDQVYRHSVLRDR